MTNWKPVGNKILVLMDKAETKTASGIVIASGTFEERAEMAQMRGTVVAMGESAYHDQPTKWVKIGDRVMVAKYAGFLHNEGDPKSPDRYRIIHDLDVLAVLKESNDE